MSGDVPAWLREFEERDPDLPSPLLRKIHGSADVRLRHYRKIDPDTGCWNWTRGLKDGYGRLTIDGKTISAHRLSYETYIGPVPDGLEVDHICRNRRCFNPDHLEAVSRLENMRRARLIGYDHPSAPKTCKWGHGPEEFREYTRANGAVVRVCRGCERERSARRNRKSQHK